jgi:thiol-disulfide isomerase/thioredoxin
MVALQLLLIATALGAEGETVLLNFSGPNCTHCRAMEPALSQLEAAGMPVRTINVEQHPEIARRFNVTGIPTFVMLVNGKEANRVVGSTSAEKLQALFPVNLAPPSGDVRGQSPSPTPSNNYVGQRLGGLFGKGKPADTNGAPGVDPFTQRATATAPVSFEPINSLGPATAPEATRVSASPAQRLAVPALPATQQNPQTRAMAASVRLKVEDAKGHSMGSGTIIDTHGNEAVIITCGHIFRDSQGRGRISVDLFHPQPRTVEGKLLEYDLQRDIAMISIAPGPGIISAAVVAEGTQLAKGDDAFSIGCDKGQDPTLRNTQISGLNRYQGPPNIEAKGQPVDGRSGGGLFARDGHLIGVCNAADPADDEGIYAAAGTIHWQLAKVGLDHLFKPSARADLMAEEPAAPDEAINRLAENEPNLPVLAAEAARDQVARSAAVAPEMRPTASVQPASLAAAHLPTAGGDDTEVICIVRSKSNPAVKGKVFLIERASDQLLQQLASDATDPAVAADLALHTNSRPTGTPVAGAPVVRGQSRR